MKAWIAATDSFISINVAAAFSFLVNYRAQLSGKLSHWRLALVEQCTDFLPLNKNRIHQTHRNFFGGAHRNLPYPQELLRLPCWAYWFLELMPVISEDVTEIRLPRYVPNFRPLNFVCMMMGGYAAADCGLYRRRLSMRFDCSECEVLELDIMVVTHSTQCDIQPTVEKAKFLSRW